MEERITRIYKRQLARFLSHLDKTGQLTPDLEKDVKRSFGFIFEDVMRELGHDKENANVNQGNRESI